MARKIKTILVLIYVAFTMQYVHMIRLRGIDPGFDNFFKAENIALSIFYFLILSFAVYIYEDHNSGDE